MKLSKNLFLVFIFTIATKVLIAQPQYFNVGTEWFETASYGASPNCLWTYTTQFTIIGDTTINGKVYHQIYYRRDEQNFFNNPSCGPAGFYSGIGPLLRQDGKNILRMTNNGEEGLYDFDLQVGDTIQFKPSYTDTVVGIDSVLINNTWRKKFMLSNYFGFGNNFIIEGIGHSSGLFYSDNPGPHISYNSSMLCFKQNGVSYLGGQCFFNLGISEDLPELKIYPNPVTEFLEISYPSSDSFQFTITNLSGVPLIKGSLKENLRVDVSRLNSGVYILQVRIGNKIRRLRFVKI